MSKKVIQSWRSLILMIFFLLKTSNSYTCARFISSRLAKFQMTNWSNLVFTSCLVFNLKMDESIGFWSLLMKWSGHNSEIFLDETKINIYWSMYILFNKQWFRESIFTSKTLIMFWDQRQWLKLNSSLIPRNF